MSDFKAVQLKRSTSAGAVPAQDQLADGELAINLIDKRLYSRYNGEVFTIGSIVDDVVFTDAVQDDAITTSKIADGVVTTVKLADDSVTSSKIDSTVISAVINSAYPVGSIYISTLATNPGTTFGVGTWESFGSGKTLIGAGSGFTAGATGGSADSIVVSHTHTGSTDSAGTHAHAVNPAFIDTANPGSASGPEARVVSSAVATASWNTGNAGLHNHNITMDTTGESGVDKNLPPYIVTYFWQRTA